MKNSDKTGICTEEDPAALKDSDGVPAVLKYNMEAFLPVNHRSPLLCVLDIDIIEPELLIRIIAEDASRSLPASFCGEGLQVFTRLKYTAPDEPFQEIQKLILQIRKAAGFRSVFRGIIAIDVSEYKGHEEEEYFTIFLKFLYDNARGCKIVLVCSQYEEQDVKKLLGGCMRFFPIQHEKMEIFEREQLRGLIRSAFHEYMLEIDSENVERIAEMVSDQSLRPFRSLQLIERIPAEISLMKEGVRSLKEAILSYFQNPYSPICMLAGRPLFFGKEGSAEHVLS